MWGGKCASRFTCCHGAGNVPLGNVCGVHLPRSASAERLRISIVLLGFQNRVTRTSSGFLGQEESRNLW